MINTLPKGYKQSEVGVIPENWEVMRLANVVDFLDYKRKPLKSGERQKIQGQYPYYGASGIIDFINDYIFNEELILIGEDGANIIDRNSRLVFLASGKYWVNNHAHVLKSKNSVNNYYICEYLESLKYDKYNTGTAQPKLNKDILSNIQVLIPPKPEQEKIAKILTTWDSAIEQQQTLINQKQQLKKGLMQQLLTGKTRFTGFTDDWQVVKLEDICKISKGVQLNKNTLDDRGKYPVINGGITPSGYSENWNTIENTITISEGGNSCGFVNYITEKFWSGGHCYVLSDLQAEQLFLYQFLKFSQNNIMKLRVGSGLPNIQKNSIGKFITNFPSNKEQQKIAKILNNADKEIELLKNELNELKQQKKALMQKLLTGKIRVNHLTNQ